MNLTVPLFQKLFSELDPHKKGFININDWKNTFRSFVGSDMPLIELKSVAMSTFSDAESLFSFFTTFGPKGALAISRKTFELAVNSLMAGRFKKSDVEHIWKQVSEASSPDRLE